MGSLGGPLRRDRLHFYGGYHWIRRDSSSALITVAPEDAERLNIVLPPGRILDEGQTEHFAFGKLDYQASPAHRGRCVSPRSSMTRRSPVFRVSSAGPGLRYLRPIGVRRGTGRVPGRTFRRNEVRVQYARRVMSRRDSRTTAPPPAIDIAGVAFFGGPYAAVQSGDSDFTEAIWQVIDNFSWQTGRHTYKTGIDVQRIADGRVTPGAAGTGSARSTVTLPPRAGSIRGVYQSYLEDVGNPTIAYRTTFVSVFGQDEWLIAPRVKLLYGLRYDRFGTPMADGGGPAFAIDRNNLAPRLGQSGRSMQPRGQLFGRLSGGSSIHPCSVCTRTRCCAGKTEGCRPSWCVPVTLARRRFPRRSTLSSSSRASSRSRRTSRPSPIGSRTSRSNVPSVRPPRLR